MRLFLLLFSFFCVRASDNSCHEPLSTAAIGSVSSYLRVHFDLPPSAAITVLQDVEFKDTCYREVTINALGWKTPVVFYISPDRRFLSASLVDLKERPEDWWSAASKRIDSLLVSGLSPVDGDSAAPVTIVEFTDYQCPYCKRFNDLVQSLPVDLRASVRVVHKNLPGLGHSWASPAAKLAVCAAEQSSAAFSSIKDFLFDHQSSLTAENLTEQVTTYISQNRTSIAIDAGKLLGCAAESRADQAISADFALAKQFNISGTPTIFINGVRSSGFSDAKGLAVSIETALRRRKTADSSGRGTDQK